MYESQWLHGDLLAGRAIADTAPRVVTLHVAEMLYNHDRSRAA